MCRLIAIVHRRHPRLLLAALIGFCSWMGAPTPARAALEGENVGKALQAVRTRTPPVIDGRLDDEAWRTTRPDDRFVQGSPDDGGVPSERTDVRILYDDGAVYVGVRAHDTQPERIVARLSHRDRDVEADWIGIGIDSRMDHSSAFVFVLNAAGVQTDLRFFDDTNASADWDAVWEGASARDPGGWSAEFRVPLSVLRFTSAPTQEWGFNVVRYISRKKEQEVWAHVPRGVNADVSRWGHIIGLEGIRPRRTFELRPYFAASMRTTTEEGGAVLGLDPHAYREGHGEVGLDLKLGVTSNLTLDATVNPDFGQVEADPAVLNLSPFESFFPEKRPFFLEGADVFTTPIQVFYSRRIGRPPSALVAGDSFFGSDGRELQVTNAPTALRLWSAAKLTGSLGGRLTLGALDALTGPETLNADDPLVGNVTVRRAPARNYAALRARWSLGGASSVGLLATAVTWLPGEVAVASADHDAYVQSADGLWASQSGVWRLAAQVLASERVGGPSHADAYDRPCVKDAANPECVPLVRADGTREEPGDVGVGGYARIDHSSRNWVWNTSYRALSRHLELNDFGFVQQFNQHVVDASGGWRCSTPGGAFVDRSWGASSHLVYDWDGVRLESSVATNANATWSNYWSSFGAVRVSIPGQWNAYETGDGAYLERLTYLMFETFHETDGRKPVSLGVGGGGGRALADPAYFAWSEAKLSFNRIPQAELELGANLSWEGHDLRAWFNGGCIDEAGHTCTIDTDMRTYRLAELSDAALSLTLRGSYILSSRLSLQAYAQLFMSEGSFSERRVIRTRGPRPRLYRDQLVYDPLFTGDETMDGQVDDGFQDTSLNVNLVLRWEVSPGSTLLGVYTRAQNAAYDLVGRTPRFHLTGIDSGPTEEVLLMKFVYFYG